MTQALYNLSPVRRRDLAAASRACAAISLLFCAVIAAMLLGMSLKDHQSNPLDAPVIDRLKSEIRQHPTDDSLKETLRKKDARLRADFWWSREAATRAGYLLLAGAIVAVLGFKSARFFDRPLPTLEQLQSSSPSSHIPANCRAIAASSLVIAAFFAALTFFSLRAGPIVPIRAPEAAQPLATITPPSPADLQSAWPTWRGHDGAARVASGAWPARWNAATNENILWKSPIPLPGHSSPILWKDRLFVTGADATHRELYAFDIATGRFLWTGKVSPTDTTAATSFEETGFAAPTPATDGTNVYAIFASGDVAAFDLQGASVWTRHLGPSASQYTYAASLAIASGKLIVQWDVGEDRQKSASALLALDTATGRTLWRTPRDAVNSWSSPIVAEVDGTPQIITAGNPWIAAYDPATGAELWKAKLMDGDVAASPICIDGIVYLANDRAIMAAIDARKARGDVTASAVRWKQSDDGLPEFISPISDGKLLWTFGSNGSLFCFDTKGGARIWEQEFPSIVRASPALVGNELWITDAKGQTHILSTGRTYEQLRENTLGEPVSANLAFAAGKVFIRGKSNMYCIGGKP